MAQTIQAKDLTLHDVKAKFRLRPAKDEQFFREWINNLPTLTDSEKRSLDQVKADYFHLSEYPMPESLIKMVVLSPLLALAGFYRFPFRIATESPVQIAVEDEEAVVQGRIDVLVIQDRFWVLVIESKRGSFSLEPAIPQALAYMSASPNAAKQPTYGLATNGSNFIFLKLTTRETSEYALSDEFTLRRGDDLYNVLSILKQLNQCLH